MGNQGMKNWKLTALFAISLMLIAGLFTDAAVARDGAGTASVTWDHSDHDEEIVFRDGHALYENSYDSGDGTVTRLVPVPLPAGSRENQLIFSYYTTVNMAGGEVVIELPADWKINKTAHNIRTLANEAVDPQPDPPPDDFTADGHGRYLATGNLVEVQERFGRLETNTAIIYITDRDGKHRTITAGDATATSGTILDADAAADAAAIKLQTDRVTVADGKVTIQLSNAWRSGGELVVVLRDVQTAIPNTLPSTAGVETVDPAINIPYFDYQFRVKSRKTGRLDTLDPILIDHDGDDANNNKVKDDADLDTSTDLVGQTATAQVYSKQPSVRVGNILGEKGGETDNDNERVYIQYYGPDQVDRAFAFTPMDVYTGESDIDFTMTFEAKGPMYGFGASSKVVIGVPIPEALRVSATDTDAIAAADPAIADAAAAAVAYYESHIAVSVTGRAKPSRRLDAGSEFTVAADGAISINFDYLNKGAKVTLTYDFEGGMDTDYPNTAVGEEFLTPANDPSTDAKNIDESLTGEVSAFTDGDTAGTGTKRPTISTLLPARTTGEVPIDSSRATSVSGAQIRPIAGSGTMAFTRPSDAQVEAGEDVSKLTLTYEAATDLSGSTLTIVVDGIQLVEDEDDTATRDPAIGPLQNSDPDGYGYVDGSDIPSAPALTISAGVPAAGQTTLTWSNLMLDAGDKFVTTIEDVRIIEESTRIVAIKGAPEFTTSLTATLDGTARALSESPKLYITATMDNAVEFTLGGQVSQTYAAAGEGELTFAFTAKDTSIRDGRVRFTVPDNWTKPEKPDAVTDKVAKLGELAVTGGDIDKDNITSKVSVSGQTVTVNVPMLEVGESVKITLKNFTGDDEIAKMVAVQPNATEPDKPVKIVGRFWTRSPHTGSGHNAGTVTVEIGNAPDGFGTATIDPDDSLKAGSEDEEITVRYTVPGTMEGGAVRLSLPNSQWGSFQDDDATEANYLEVDVSGGGSATANVGPNAAIATLSGVAEGSVVIFRYGGGTVASRNGAQVQSALAGPKAPAAFVIASDGDGNGSFMPVRGMQRTKKQKEADKESEEKPLGAVYATDKGSLFVTVTGADDGNGSAEVEIVNTGQGTGKYPDILDIDGDRDTTELVDSMRIHAGDTGTYLKFTYTPTQTLQNGQLIFETQGGWSAPQNNSGSAGYTYFTETGTAEIDEITFDEDDDSVTLDIGFIDPEGTIEIHYGAYEGDDDGSGAVAPTARATSSPFMMSIKGGDATTNRARPIKTFKGKAIAVRVYSQASGGGNASASVSDNKGDVGAGDMGREVTVVYTAAGQISGGSLKLTVPWSHPTTDTVTIESTGTIDLASARYGGDYIGDPDVTTDDDFPVGADGTTALLGGKDVTVGGVSLAAGQTVTFEYSNAMVQPTIDDPAFVVAVAGGDGPGEDPAGVTPDPADALTVAVGNASPGSGSGTVELEAAIIANTGGNTLTFIYTPAGQIDDRSLDIRVDVPTGWSEPTDSIDTADKGTYTVVHEQRESEDEDHKRKTAAAAAVEKIGPFDRQMAARLKFGESIGVDDQIVFTYENADSPTTVGGSTFVMYFGESQVTTDTDLTVLVGSGKPAVALDVSVSADMILLEDDESVTVTVMLQDEDGNDVPATEDMDVMLASDSATGSFMVDGVEVDAVTIMAGSSSAMADYTNSTVGAAMITASSGTLTEDTATVTVTSDVVEITSATVTSLAKAGGTVTVVAMGTTGKTAMFSVGSIVTDGTMMEDETGSYSGSFAVVVDQHPDGMYSVTVNLNGESMMLTDALTIDSTAPTVTVSDIEGMVANGDTVMISAMADDGAGSGVASVMADVSMLDSTQTDMVALTMANGAYSAEVMISEDNAAMNGEQTITVTAMDAAGNSSAPATVMVTLLNTLSFTSTLPAGISLFHVPLDVEGLDTVGDLETMLGDNVSLLITYDGTTWNSRSDDVMITATLGILVSMSAETMVTFEGNAWVDSSITLAAGSNLIGLPVNDPNVTMISDIIGLFSANTVSSVIVASGGEFQAVAAAGDAADGPVAGDAAYLVVATAAGSAMLSGDGWMNGSTSAAPIALAGYTVDNQTPVLDLLGSVVDEITGLAKEGFRVKAKNLSTKAALSNVTSVEATDGYNMTFVDLADSYAARVGDVLEISADSPDPLLGIKPVRHIVTVDDVKNSRIQLEDLIAYEIPAETELLRNYPNPFNPETWIPYRLAEDADVSLTIYDTSGALVRSIDLGHQTAAVYETRAKAIYWDGRNRFGEQVASGIYFYSLSTGDFSATRKMVILK